AFANICSNPLSFLPGQSGCASPQFVYLRAPFPRLLNMDSLPNAPEGSRFGASATRRLESLTWGFSVVMVIFSPAVGLSLKTLASRPHRRYHVPPRAACHCENNRFTPFHPAPG